MRQACVAVAILVLLMPVPPAEIQSTAADELPSQCSSTAVPAGILAANSARVSRDTGRRRSRKLRARDCSISRNTSSILVVCSMSVSYTSRLSARKSERSENPPKLARKDSISSTACASNWLDLLRSPCAAEIRAKP